LVPGGDSMTARAVCRIALMVLCLMTSSMAMSGDERNPAKEKTPARTDVHGDPLPAGVLARLGSVRLDCEESVRQTAFAPDGKSLSVLAETRDKQLWFFEIPSGKALRRISLPQGPREYALTPDNRFLAVRTDHQKEVLDKQTRKTVRRDFYE